MGAVGEQLLGPHLHQLGDSENVSLYLARRIPAWNRGAMLIMPEAVLPEAVPETSSTSSDGWIARSGSGRPRATMAA